MPKGYFPQDDTGLIFGGTRAAPDISFEAMKELQQRATQIVLSDPAVAAVGSSVGASGWNASVNNGRLFISLKPPSERPGVTSQTVINRLRPKLLDVGGMRVFMFPAQDVRGGGRQSSSSYQYTLWSPNLDELLANVPRVVAKVQTLPELVDVTTDREQNGLQANVVIDRQAASRYGVRIQDIDNALNNAFAQRQISTIYSERNQYRVILEIDPLFQRDPSDLTRLYVAGADGVQVPLSSVARIERGLAPLVINHQGSFPVGHRHLQPRAEHHAVAGAGRDRPGGGRAASAGIDPRRAGRRRAAGAAVRRHAAAGDPGGAARGLHHPRRAVREPGAPADHHLHAAVRRPRRAAGAAWRSTPSSP